jgi:hypothetical protein
MQTDGLWCRVVGRMEILPISGVRLAVRVENCKAHSVDVLLL